MRRYHCVCFGCPFACFFFNDTASTEIYTLSLHDALPISQAVLDDVEAIVAIVHAAVADLCARHDGGEDLPADDVRSEEHTSELQSRRDLVCRLLLEKKKKEMKTAMTRTILRHPRVMTASE